MNERGVRIISLEANKIYEQIEKNGEEIGFLLPQKKDYAYYHLFKNILDYSLDAIELEEAYKRICRKRFSFTDDKQKEYTLAVINVKFNYTYSSLTNPKDLRELREYFYDKGFYLDGVHYVRYKRSSGSSRQGKCLFIDERVYHYMSKWGECGLKNTGDIASWESYKALSLSSIKGTVQIPLNGILFIPDYQSEFEENVISVNVKDGKLVAENETAKIKNDIWDGESLLDESVFSGDFAEKHMLLLRNKFFKSCAFKTKLQKWFEDKSITSVDELKSRGFVTMATDIRQIVMVTTPNSMKFLKFMKGGLTEENVRAWSEKIDDTFGVVKYDKRTKFFGGRMVQTSYQFLNTIALNEAQAQQILQNSNEYIKLIRKDYDFMRYHFTDAYKREAEDEKDEIADGLAERSDVIFRLMNVNYAFKDTKLYYNFRNEVVENQKNRLKEGHVLLSGTNATLFGNGPEMLLALSGEFDLKNPLNSSVALGTGEVACARFSHGKRLVCARSPHITMGNLYCAVNNTEHELWKYFDLGENIVCVNAIGENIQQRLNGCDYDSDSMLVTDDPFVVDIAFSQNGRFSVPVCGIASTKKDGQSLAELDYATSENKIGEIVNLSQKINSILWDKENNESVSQEEKDEIYRDICILAVLSGIEIDKAKRAYASVRAGAELKRLTTKYGTIRPSFFEFFDLQEIARRVRSVKLDEDEKQCDGLTEEEAEKRNKERLKEKRKKRKAELMAKKRYQFFHSPMEYVYEEAQKIDFRKGKQKQITYLSIIDMINEPPRVKSSTVYAQRDKVLSCCEEYKDKLSFLYRELKIVDEDEQETVYEEILDLKKERNEVVASMLTEEYVLYLILKESEKLVQGEDNQQENWRLYAPILSSKLFVSMLKESKEKLFEIVENPDGEFCVYGKNYAKIK